LYAFFGLFNFHFLPDGTGQNFAARKELYRRNSVAGKKYSATEVGRDEMQQMIASIVKNHAHNRQWDALRAE
jgi:hypothetical protein